MKNKAKTKLSLRAVTRSLSMPIKNPLRDESTLIDSDLITLGIIFITINNIKKDS